MCKLRTELVETIFTNPIYQVVTASFTIAKTATNGLTKIDTSPPPIAVLLWAAKSKTLNLALIIIILKTTVKTMITNTN